MNVVVVCYGALRDHLPEGSEGNRARLDVLESAVVSEVVAALGAPERLAFAILINGEQAELGSVLREGDEVTLMPPFAGG